MTDSAWYYADDGRVVGPFRLQDLQATLADVPDWKEMPVWRAGFSGWQAAGGVEEFAGLAVAPSSTLERQPVQDRSSTTEAPAQPPGRTWPMGKVVGVIGVLVAIVIGGAFGKLIGRTIYELVTRPSPATVSQKLEERIARGYAGFQAKLPIKLDDWTTVISARNEGTKLIIGYRLEVDGGRIDDELKARLRENRIKNVCAEEQSRSVLDLGGSFRFVYADINGKPVTTIDLVVSDCP
jgi:hypothetical protein